MSDFLDLQGAKDLNTDAIHISAVANSVDPVTGAPIGTHVNRMGGTDYTLHGFWNALGPVKMPWTSVAGGTLTQPNQAFLHPANGNYYSWTGSFPHVVAPGTDPAAVAGYVPRTDVALRGELSAPGGAGLVGFQQAGSGSVLRTAQGKMRERVTLLDFVAAGDGVTDDTAVFSGIETAHTGKIVDLMGKTYLVAAVPTGNRYCNGYFKVGSSTFRAVYDNAPKFGTGRVVSGEGALASLPDDYDIGPTGCVVAMGPNAMGKMTQVKNSIAIGPNVMSEGTISRDNIGMGPDALKFVQADSPNQGAFPGTRLIALGGNSFRHVTAGNRGVAIGRNAAQAVTTGIRVTAVGSGAMSSYCPIDWTGQITNPTPVTASEVTAFGADALALCGMNENTGIGTFAGSAIKAADGNWFGGSGAGRLLDSDLSNANKVLDLTARTGTYSISGSTVTVNSVGVNAIVGNRVRLKTTTGPIPIGESVDVVVVSAPTVDQFTFTCPISGSGSGDVTIDYVETAATRTPSRWNTLTGARCGELSTHMQECTLSGYSAGKSFQGTSLTLYGWGAGFNITGGTFSSGFGHAAMRYMQDGSNTISVNNSTCLGANSRVSGDNQVQLGDKNTTTYVYGTVQNRSDARDKTDVNNTKLGIEFIMGLRPVDGRWDMRDDYFEEYEQQVGIDENAQPVFETRLRKIPKDGSKKRNRLHHWFIAQEVKALCDSLGVEFGGYQDHSINGGCDVLSLGYDEFIPPITKAIQQCWQRMDDIERRLDKLDPPEVSS